VSPTEVVVVVLALLGSEAKGLPPIELVHVRPADASPTVEGFTRPGSNRIYLLTTSEVFQEAVREDYLGADGAPIIKLASIVIHEAWHVRHGPDERGAYNAQLFTLSRLGAGPGTGLHNSVYKAMQTVLKVQRPSPPSLPGVTADVRVAVMLPVPPRKDWPSWRAMRGLIAAELALR
jgi:hypothetical protein